MDMESLMQFLPLLIPVILAEAILMVVSVIHVLKHNNYRFGNKVMWLVIVLFIQIIGPIVYFVFGRGEE